jgi:hypothetical protein
MRRPEHQGPLVKLLVEGSSPARHSFEWRDRKSIVTLTRTTNPSISLALRARMSGPGVDARAAEHPRAL